MTPIRLTTPLDQPSVRGLRVGDHVLISGLIFTARDAAHLRLISGAPAPVDLRGSLIFHCGPVIVERDGIPVCLAAGPTTSAREEPYAWQVIRDHGIAAILGKGGMGQNTAQALARHGAVYLSAIGGAAQVYACCVQEVRGVHWLDLGAPEALWQLLVRDLPALVTMDSHGGDLHAAVAAQSQRVLDRLLRCD